MDLTHFSDILLKSGHNEKKITSKASIVRNALKVPLTARHDRDTLKIWEMMLQSDKIDFWPT